MHHGAQSSADHASPLLLLLVSQICVICLSFASPLLNIPQIHSHCTHSTVDEQMNQIIDRDTSTLDKTLLMLQPGEDQLLVPKMGKISLRLFVQGIDVMSIRCILGKALTSLITF